MSNPLLETHLLPPFSQIRPEQIEAAVDQLLADNRAAIEKLVAEVTEPDWDNLIAPLEGMNDRLSQAWSPVSHMNSVVNSDALRDAYNAALPKLSQYWTELGQNQGLFRAVEKLANGPQYQALNEAQRKVIDNHLRDFRLSGIALPEAQQKRFAGIAQRLSELGTRFSNNVLDATGGWTKLIETESELAGLPPMALAAAKQLAEREDQQGWLLTLDFPSYFAVMTHADNRELRREVYEAFATRAPTRDPMPESGITPGSCRNC